MNPRWSIRAFVVGFVALLGLLPSPALAQRGNESVLIVAVQRAGKYDAKLTHALWDYLGKNGERMTKENALAIPERQCANEECLSQLASRENAKVVLTAQVQDTSPGSHFMTMLLFDAERRVPDEGRAVCDRCDPASLQHALFELGDKMLQAYRDHKATAAPAPATSPAGTAPGAQSGQPSGTAPGAELGTPIPPPPGTSGEPATGNENFFARWSVRRRVLAGVLGGLLVAALVPTIALHATDGQETTVIGCGQGQPACVLHNLPIYATGYAISGALAVGLTLTFVWPGGKSNSDTQASPMTTPAATETTPATTEGY